MTDTALDADRLVGQAVEATGARRLRRADMAGPGSSGTSTRCAPKPTCTSSASRSSSGEIVEYLSTRLGLVDWRKPHPEIADADVVPPIVIVGQARTGTTILHDLLAQDPANRVPLTWEVDRPLPPPETATYDTDPRIAGVAGAARRRRARDPGLPGDASDGRAAAAGVRAHDRRRLPQHDLPDAVPRAVVRALAARRGRHGARVPLAPHLPAAPAVAAPGAALGAQVARTSVVPRRAARRVPERAARADAPRSAADHRVAQLAHERAAPARQRRHLDPRHRLRVRRLPRRRTRPIGRGARRRHRSGRSRRRRAVPRVHGRPVRDDPRDLRPARPRARRRRRSTACASSSPRTRPRSTAATTTRSPTPGSTSTSGASARAATRSTSTSSPKPPEAEPMLGAYADVCAVTLPG